MEMIDKAGTGSHVRIHADFDQGSDEWRAARCGLLTASEMSLILTPAKLQPARNEKERAHLYELLAQRITRFVEPHFVSNDMLRGHDDEQEALRLYGLHRAPVEQVGFITNSKFGFTIGYSPDGLVGDDGLVEVKSRRQKFQVETLILHVPNKSIPAEFLIQIQTGLMVSEREWCDFLSYSGGLPMVPIRVFSDEEIQTSILEAAEGFEKRLAETMARYRAAVFASGAIPTERIDREYVL